MSGLARPLRMVEGERPPLILRRIQSYEPDWRSPDDYTVHIDGGIRLSGGFSGAMPRILRACLGCGRSSFTSARGAPHRIRGTRLI